MRCKNITIIGTSHIAKQSLEEVQDAILKEKPEIIALELDRKRFFALLHQKKASYKTFSFATIKRIGAKGFFFALLGAWVEQKLGKVVGIKPGSEMLNAIKLAQENNINIALIDQDVEITLKKFSQSLTWKEKWNFIVDLFKAIILKKQEIEFDLTKVPEEKIIKKLITEVKKRYPNIHKVLIEDRNRYMAKKLFKLLKQDKKILAIVGAGHEKEILLLLKKYEREN